MAYRPRWPVPSPARRIARPIGGPCRVTALLLGAVTCGSFLCHPALAQGSRFPRWPSCGPASNGAANPVTFPKNVNILQQPSSTQTLAFPSNFAPPDRKFQVSFNHFSPVLCWRARTESGLRRRWKRKAAENTAGSIPLVFTWQGAASVCHSARAVVDADDVVE